MSQKLLQRFHTARRDPQRAVVEGLHPLKHALRFGAEILEIVSPDPAALAGLVERLAPDLATTITARVRRVDRELFARLAPKPPATGALAIARRPSLDLPWLLDRRDPAPIVFLDRVVHLGNLGAAIRVAAAAGAAGVLTSGSHDPWNPEAIRGAAGLQWALPVTRVSELPAVDRPLVALDPDGEPVARTAIPAGSVLLFGSERNGLAPGLRARADRRIRLPMRRGVSSLNLATTVAAVLYWLLLGH